MDKAIEQAFKVFNHLAREIQIYLFSGLVVAINVLIIDYFYYHSSFLHFVRSNNLIVPSAIILYLVGQFCMAIYYVILEWTKLDRRIIILLKFEYSVDSKSLPKLYVKNPEIYIHFVERYIILTMMRWTLSAACFINLIADIFILFQKNYHWQILLATVIFAIGTLTFFILSVRTESDYSSRIESLKD